MKKIVIFLIILIAVLAGWYFVNQDVREEVTSRKTTELTADTFVLDQPQTVPTPELLKESQQTSTNNFNDWLTYKNEELGIEFKYPKDMEVIYKTIDKRVSESTYDDCTLPYGKILITDNLVIQNDVCKIPDFKKLESESDLKDSLTKITLRTYTGQMGDDEWRLFYYYLDSGDTKLRAQILGEPSNIYEEILKTIKPI